MNAESGKQPSISKEAEDESEPKLADFVWKKWTEFLKAYPLRGSVVVGLILLLIVGTLLFQLHFVIRIFFGAVVAIAVVAIISVALFAGTLTFFIIMAIRWIAGLIRPSTSAEGELVPPAQQPGPKSAWYNSVSAVALLCFVVFSQNRQNRAPVQPPALKEQQLANDKLLRQNSTQSYWQTAVASLHHIRFDMPTRDEPANAYYDRICAQLLTLTTHAESAPRTNVDPDLINMARRHLTVERRFLQAKQKTDEFIKREGIPPSDDLIADRIKGANEISDRLLTDPSLWDKIPEGELRTLLKEFMDVEQQRIKQFREIEIMQAVLQERYPGTKFPLPEAN